MEQMTQYRSTDLDLTSPDDLTHLASAMAARGFVLMRPVTRINEGEWFCGFSMGGGDYDEPEPQIAAMLDGVEGLDELAHAAWSHCTLRLFDLGYDCGRKPFSFRQMLSAQLLERLAASGGSLGLTLYSDPD